MRPSTRIITSRRRPVQLSIGGVINGPGVATPTVVDVTNLGGATVAPVIVVTATGDVTLGTAWVTNRRRNLIPAAALTFATGGGGWAAFGGEGITVTQDVTVAGWGANATRIQGNGAGSNALKYSRLMISQTGANTPHTTSVWLKNDSAGSVYIHDNVNQSAAVTAGTSQRIAVTTNQVASWGLTFYLRAAAAASVIDVTVWNPQIERALSASDWDGDVDQVLTFSTPVVLANGDVLTVDTATNTAQKVAANGTITRHAVTSVVPFRLVSGQNSLLFAPAGAAMTVAVNPRPGW